MRTLRHGLVLALLLPASMGCITVGNLQRANTAGKGNVQFSVSPLALGIAVSVPKDTTTGGTSTGSSASTPTSMVFPSLEGAFRYGITDNIDIGGRLSTVGGVEFTAKFQLTPPTSSVIVSLAPGVGGIGLSANAVGFGIINAELPILIGIPLGPHQLVIGPRIQELLLFAGTGTPASNASVGVTFLGASVGFAIKAGENFTIMPELALTYPTLGAAAAGSTSTAGGVGQAGVFFYQVGVGFIVGGK